MVALFADLQKSPEIKISWIGVENLYKVLLSPQRADVLPLENVFVTCVLGQDRSPIIASHLQNNGATFASEACLNGFSIHNLPKLIDAGNVDEDGFIKPKGFGKSVQRLFVSSSFCDNWDKVFIEFITSISKLRKRNPQKEVKLDIVVVEGTGVEVCKCHTKYTGVVFE